MELRVKDAMPLRPPSQVDARAGVAFDLLLGLAAVGSDDPVQESWLAPRRSPQLARDLAQVGARPGEAWLHLLGVALEAPAELDAAAFVRHVAGLDPHELRRHLVGVHVPAWRDAVGAETLELAAAGDRRASRKLLASERYYAGRARESLGTLLPLSARETKRRLVAALRRFAAEELAPHEADVAARLRAEAEAKRALARTLAVEPLVAVAAPGYAYEPEPELPRVVLVPHLAARPWLLLCQHRDARLICYPAADEPQVGEQALRRDALALGRALADESRVAMLRLLAGGSATLGELAAAASLAKSTAHHHLALLREAGLVTLRGNARSYRYELRGAGLGEARSLLGRLERE